MRPHLRQTQRPHTYVNGVCSGCSMREEWKPALGCAQGAKPPKPPDAEKAAARARSKLKAAARRATWRKADAKKRAARKSLAAALEEA